MKIPNNIPTLVQKLEIDHIPRAFVRKLAHKSFRTLLLVASILLFSFFIYLNVYHKETITFTMDKEKMLREECMRFIGKVADECLKLKTRKEQNKMFSSVKVGDLPLKPIKMTLTTAVWLYKPDTKEQYVIKRVIFRSDSPTQEDVISYISRHKNIIRTIGTAHSTHVDSNGDKKKIIWLFSEYLPFKISHNSSWFNKEELRNMLKDVLTGLVYLHEKMNIIHLDLKIANIMAENVRNKKVYKIIDFGYSRDLNKESEIDGDGLVKIPEKSYGTYPYKPPEVVFENYHGKASDIWCIGAIAWFITIKEIPFYKSDKEKDVKKWRVFLEGTLRHKFDSDIDPLLKDFILKCMLRRPQKRPTARELLSHPFITGKESKDNGKKVDSKSDHDFYHEDVDSAYSTESSSL